MLETSRLILRQWEKKDFAPFASMNADPDVMRFFPAILQEERSHALAMRFSKDIRERGWGVWAVELKESHSFIGFVGLNPQPEQFVFSPCVEISWRLDKAYWHKGLAREAAEACLSYAFNVLGLKEVVSFTSKLNIPSEELMKRLGMIKRGEFFHPALPLDHELSPHVLYGVQ